MMKMEILYFDGCPTYVASEKTLREVLEEQGIAAEVELVAVNTDGRPRSSALRVAPRSGWAARTCSPCRSGRSTRLVAECTLPLMA